MAENDIALPVIITCGCGDTNRFVMDAFRILFPEDPVPPIKQGSTDCKSPQIAALAKSGEKYAYLFHPKGTWDLLKGVQVA